MNNVVAVLVSGCLAFAGSIGLAQTTIDTGFRPSTNGYRFRNFGNNNLFTIPVLNVSVPSSGNCYGFAARTTDHHRYGVPIPTNTPRTQEQEVDLISRQWDFGNELPHVGLQMASALLVNTLPDDYQWLKTKLQAGLPWPIVGTGAPILYSGLGPFPLIHALVAYKIVENYQGISGRHAIYLYDSNRPSDDNVVAIVEPSRGVFALTSYWEFSWFTTLRAYSPLSPSTINNSFSAAIGINGLSGSTMGSNIDASKEAGEPNHAGNAGGKSVWWRWTAPSSGEATMQTLGSTFDTLLAVYTGGAVGSLTYVASNDDAGTSRQSRVVFNATSGIAYRIAVDGYAGASGNILLNWGLNRAPTNIALSNSTVPENQPSGTAVGILSTTAPDASSTFTYTLVTGAGSTGNASFMISGSTLQTAASFNYEVQSNFSIRVQSADQGGLFTQKVFAVAVSDVSETPPAFLGLKASDGNDVVLKWSSVTNHSYTIHFSTNLLTGFSLLESNILATPVVNTYTDSVQGVPVKLWQITTEP